MGYTLSSPEDSDFEDDDGLADTLMGIRWNFLDEFEADSPYVPTLTLRLGGIVEGTYEESQPHSAGDGASGGDISLLFGKSFTNIGFGLFGDIGYRIRGENVPEDFFTSAGIYKTITGGLAAGFAYRHIEGLSGLDIGGPGFDPSRFPELKEIQQNVEFGLSYQDGGGRFYQIFYARTIDGRNTGEKDIVGVSVLLPF